MKVQVNKKVPNFNVSVTGKDQLNSKDLLGKKVVIYLIAKPSAIILTSDKGSVIFAISSAGNPSSSA